MFFRRTFEKFNFVNAKFSTIMKHLLFIISLSLSIALFSQSEKNTLPSPGDTIWKVKTIKTKAEWKKILSAEQYDISREEGTERPFTKNNFNDNHEKGMYYCASCNNPLFSSAQKFDSGTGWPSFWRVYSSKSVLKSEDNSLGMSRDAISCKRCDAHLGHVFNDGPKPTGLRYCMNGLVMTFKKS